jgi:DNA-binding Lrp family transcriptional regulator
MVRPKIEDKFYPLQRNEWVNACKKLSSGARDVLYYIRTADPYSNGTELAASAIAKDLGCNRSTVSRALKELDAKGYIDMEILVARVRLVGKGLLYVADLQSGCNSAEAVAKMQQPPQKNNDSGKNATLSATLQQPTLETLTPTDFQPLKTSKDSNKINQTLSEATRERNLVLFKSLSEEVQREIRRYGYAIAIPKLPIKPTLPDAWIIRHCEELFNQMMVDVEFQKSNSGKCSGNSPAVENEVIEW